jgi:hypothetical protein
MRKTCLILTFLLLVVTSAKAFATIYPNYDEEGTYLGCTFLDGAYLEGYSTNVTISPAVVGEEECFIMSHHDPPKEPQGIDFEVTGGFSVDSLTDSVYSLELREGRPEPHFQIVKDRNAEESLVPSVVIMAHLIRPRRIRLEGFNWAPISLGLGIGENSSLRTFVGTSVHFGSRLFLTAGGVLGRTSRLPAGLKEGDVTTDPNALADLPRQNEVSWFLGLSYRFGTSGAFPRAFKLPAKSQVKGGNAAAHRHPIGPTESLY